VRNPLKILFDELNRVQPRLKVVFQPIRDGVNMIFLEICDSKLCCYYDKQENESSERELSWSVEIDKILLIAEYTTNEGPYCDDYFLVFVSQPYFYQCTYYAEGREEVIQTLSEQLGTPLQHRLCNSTDWKSNVIWPVEFEVCDFFQFSEVIPDRIISKARKIILGPQLEYKIAEPIRKFLETKSAMINSDVS
jgi:hypothetical protein